MAVRWVVKTAICFVTEAGIKHEWSNQLSDPQPREGFTEPESSELGFTEDLDVNGKPGVGGKWLTVPGSKSETATKLSKSQLLQNFIPDPESPPPPIVSCALCAQVHLHKSNGTDGGFLISQYGNIT